MGKAADKCSRTRFCVVGLGGHSLTKLIPAIIASGQHIVGAVTSKSATPQPIRPTFSHIEQAIETLSADTVFVIATPPPHHFKHAMLALAAGRDVIVEKPAFVSAGEAKQAFETATDHGAILVEAFMHRHTDLYRRFLQIWYERRSSIEALDIDFTIPELPGETFRMRSDITCSGLFDVGSYAVSLLHDVGLPLSGLRIRTVDFCGDTNRELLQLGGTLDGVRVSIRAGVQAPYTNSVSLKLHDAETIGFSPFFYGRESEKMITRHSDAGPLREQFLDRNAFEVMFGLSREAWMKSQASRARATVAVTKVLEKLGENLSDLRKKASDSPFGGSGA